MLLTCPQCRSGLQVPDDTTAMVRCPACKTVFSPADGAGPEPDEVEDEPKARKPGREDEDEDERPRKKARRRPADEEEDDEDEQENENRDFDPITEEEDRARRRRKRLKADDLSPAERAARRAAFQRATWGCRLIWISFALFLLSMAVILVFFFQFTFRVFTPSYITIAGILGLFNWLLAAVGVGLCLSGPRAPGHWGYGISAAVATAIHGIFLLAIVTQGRENVIGRDVDDPGVPRVIRWAYLPTNLTATMFYMTAVCYPNEQGVIARPQSALAMVTGVAEMVRTLLIMMLLSCLSRAALDEELAHKCTRAAGTASVAPALAAFIILLLCAFIVETNAEFDLFTRILYATVRMSVYAVLMGVVFPSFMTAREVTDACEEPFQSLIPQL